MSARDVSNAKSKLDEFVELWACTDMDDDGWREYAHNIIDLAKAEMREEIRAGVKPETPPSEPAAPQERWEIELEIWHPDGRHGLLQSIVIGSHATEKAAKEASNLLNSILGSLYVFSVNEV